MGSAGYHRLVFINSKRNLSSVSFAVQYENHNDSLFKQWHPQLKDKLTKIIFLVNLGLSFLNLTDKRRGKRLIFLCYPTKCMSSIVIFPRTLIILDMIKECHNKGITVRCSGKFDFIYVICLGITLTMMVWKQRPCPTQKPYDYVVVDSSNHVGGWGRKIIEGRSSLNHLTGPILKNERGGRGEKASRRECYFVRSQRFQ